MTDMLWLRIKAKWCLVELYTSDLDLSYLFNKKSVIFLKIPPDKTFQNSSCATYMLVILLIATISNSVESKLHKLGNIFSVSFYASPFVIDNLHDLFWHKWCREFPARFPAALIKPCIYPVGPKNTSKMVLNHKKKSHGSRWEIFFLIIKCVCIATTPMTAFWTLNSISIKCIELHKEFKKNYFFKKRTRLLRESWSWESGRIR